MKPFLQIIFAVSCVIALAMVADYADKLDRAELDARFSQQGE